MSRVIRDFDAKLTAWLDDESATGLPEAEHLHRPSDGSLAAQRAFDEADSHTLCGADDRDYNFLVAVYGKDKVETIISVPPSVSIYCVRKALHMDDEVIAYQVIGVEPEAGEPGDEAEDDDMGDESAGGIIVTSLVPGMQATWLGDEDGGPSSPRRRWLALADIGLLAAAAVIVWRLVRRH